MKIGRGVAGGVLHTGQSAVRLFTFLLFLLVEAIDAPAGVFRGGDPILEISHARFKLANQIL